MFSLKLTLLLTLSYFFIFSDLNFHGFSVNALNVGVQSSGVALKLGKECSRKCESEFCSVPPFLRYGKYCGLLYSGCPGERPCDGLDACCMKHDMCVSAKNNNYLSQECSKKFISCMESFRSAGAHSFKGSTCDANDVIDVLKVVMEAALLAGGVFKKP
ncbi:phospholipase A2-alpha [Beta vulgaris subsp. vulgaris]|uniref:phospholipase A2-alpha n=1 Tax=Beta vulgaris subsp. vulgaris TaxID=3555 RepID=UPI00053FA0EF|nr:phospholipase A2-alpha [Beta vulgaris subsp. vulgaris]